jgi:hypothetical protein
LVRTINCLEGKAWAQGVHRETHWFMQQRQSPIKIVNLILI